LISLCFVPLLLSAAREVRSLGWRSWVAVAMIAVGPQALATVLFTEALMYVFPATLSPASAFEIRVVGNPEMGDRFQPKQLVAFHRNARSLCPEIRTVLGGWGRVESPAFSGHRRRFPPHSMATCLERAYDATGKEDATGVRAAAHQARGAQSQRLA
jgi:hypothetical protein